MLTHCVFFWLKEHLSPSEEETFQRGLSSLTRIAGVLQASAGAPAATDRPRGRPFVFIRPDGEVRRPSCPRRLPDRCDSQGVPSDLRFSLEESSGLRLRRLLTHVLASAGSPSALAPVRAKQCPRGSWRCVTARRRRGQLRPWSTSPRVARLRSGTDRRSPSAPLYINGSRENRQRSWWCQGADTSRGFRPRLGRTRRRNPWCRSGTSVESLRHLNRR